MDLRNISSHADGRQSNTFLGSRFRLDDGSPADYNGPYYDVYKVSEQTDYRVGSAEQLKLYYFNSETLLLERVIYEIDRNGATVKVEERLGVGPETRDSR